MVTAFAIAGGAPASAATGDVSVPTSGQVTGNVAPLHCDGSGTSAHTGIDIAAGEGSSIVAGASGTVAAVVNSSGTSGYGTYVSIAHGAGYQTFYGHMVPGSPTVSVGQQVSKGQRIGSVGNSGASRGFHLHFEVRLNGATQSGMNSYFPCWKQVTQGAAIDWSFPGFPGDNVGSTRPGVAFRGLNGSLWSWSGQAGAVGFGADTKVGVAEGTSPASRTDGTSQSVAFAAGGSNSLWTWSGQPGQTGFAADAKVGVKPDTSPAITRLANGQYAVAFQASSGDLWIWKGQPGTVGYAQSTGYGMKVGTNPTITAQGDRIIAAFQSNGGLLHVWAGTSGAAGAANNQGITMKAGTSPSISSVGSNLAIAYQPSGGGMGIWTGGPLATGSHTTIGLGVTGSPAITTMGSQIAIAFNASGNTLWTWVGTPGGSGLGYNQGAGLKAGSSPSITALSSASVAIAFQANTSEMHTYRGDPKQSNAFIGAKLGMTGTPSIG